MVLTSASAAPTSATTMNSERRNVSDGNSDNSPNGDFLINGQRVRDIPLATVMYVSPPPLEATAVPVEDAFSSTNTATTNPGDSNSRQQQQEDSFLSHDALHYDHTHELFDGGDSYFDDDDVIRSTTSEPLPPRPPSYNPEYDDVAGAPHDPRSESHRPKKKKPVRRRSASPLSPGHSRTDSNPSAPHRPPHKPPQRRASLKDVREQSQQAWENTVEKAKQLDEHYKLREKSEWMLEKTKTAAIATHKSLLQFNKDYKPVKKAQNAVLWATSSKSVSSNGSTHSNTCKKSKDRKKKKKGGGEDEEAVFNPARKTDSGNPMFRDSLSKDF